jgi:excisionase family DNA binding protein
MVTKAQTSRSGESYLTVAQAAEQLGVHQSTIRRWIDAGILTAYRVGPKRVRIRAADVERTVVPRRGARQKHPSMPKIRRHMTKAEQKRALNALAEMERFSAEMAAKYGKPDVEGWVLINESRDERSRQLSGESET